MPIMMDDPTDPMLTQAYVCCSTRRSTALAHIKSASDIALEMGYSRPNYFLMILNGDTKLPLDKVPVLAKALQADAKLLFRLALVAQSPELSKFLEKIFDEDGRSRRTMATPENNRAPATAFSRRIGR
jgi:hypothetical protein